MHRPPSLPAPRDGHLEALAEEVAQLRDLFQRRLLEDKSKNKLYEELYEQLTIARGGLAEQLLAPLFRELLLVVDRVERLIRDDDVVLESINDELLDLLERRGVRPVPAAGRFDPSVHEAVRTEPSGAEPPGTIVEVLRRGYTMGTKLLRPEQVVVASSSLTQPDEKISEGSSLVATEQPGERE